MIITWMLHTPAHLTYEPSLILLLHKPWRHFDPLWLYFESVSCDKEKQRLKEKVWMTSCFSERESSRSVIDIEATFLRVHFKIFFRSWNFKLVMQKWRNKKFSRKLFLVASLLFLLCINEHLPSYYLRSVEFNVLKKVVIKKRLSKANEDKI